MTSLDAMYEITARDHWRGAQSDRPERQKPRQRVTGTPSEGAGEYHMCSDANPHPVLVSLRLDYLVPHPARFRRVDRVPQFGSKDMKRRLCPRTAVPNFDLDRVCFLMSNKWLSL
jgi:hypothetical protein